MARTRIYIDSVLDRDTVRVLISTDGRKETPHHHGDEGTGEAPEGQEGFLEDIRGQT